jgi:preprotein translocase subunit SecA
MGGNKSEKDVKQLEPMVVSINQYFQQYQSLSNDALRSKTQEFKQRIKDHLKEIDALLKTRNSKQRLYQCLTFSQEMLFTQK